MTQPGMDLTCEELVELITEYLEGAMPPAERVRFEDHLQACAGCRTYIDHMHTTLGVLGRLREEDLPPEAQERLLATFRTWKQGR